MTPRFDRPLRNPAISQQKKQGSGGMLRQGLPSTKQGITGRWPCGKALAAVAALYLTFQAGVALAQSADTVLFNGKILTVDKDFRVQEALAIPHAQVLASGTSAAMKKLAGNQAKRIDLGGRTA